MVFDPIHKLLGGLMKQLILVFLCLSFGVSTLMAVRDFERIYIGDTSEAGISLDFIVSLEGSGIAYVPGNEDLSELELGSRWTGWKTATVESPAYLGFRALDEPLVNPLFSTTTPGLDEFTPLENDPQGDDLFGVPSLDIRSSKISFTEDRIYFAMQVAGGSFPVSSGFTYYAYMPIIVDPSADVADDPIVYGLMYTVDLGAIVGPALYKISGSGFGGLTRLGDIQHYVEDETLVLSCSLADLFADPDFSQWFDPDYPLLATSTTTSRISLVNGIQQADMTQGIKVLLKPQYLEYQNLVSPQIIDPQMDISGSEIVVSLRYWDQDANVPSFVRIRFDDSQDYELLQPQDSQNLNFFEPVAYQSPTIPLPDDWNSITIEVSDDEDIVQAVLYNPVSIPEDTQIPMAEIKIHPFPASSSLEIKISGVFPKAVSIYNLKGQKIKELALNGEDSRISLEDFASGLYFLKVEGYKAQRFMVIR